MRISLACGLILLTAAAPAWATQSLHCAPVAGGGPSLLLVIGSGAGPAVVGATLGEGRVRRSTAGGELAIGQSWIDAERVWLDLTDVAAIRYEARLRATFKPKWRGRPAIGTLQRNGRTWRVRCIES